MEWALLLPGVTFCQVILLSGLLIDQPAGGNVLPSKPSLTGNEIGLGTDRVAVNVSFEGTWSAPVPFTFFVKNLKALLPFNTFIIGKVIICTPPEPRLVLRVTVTGELLFNTYPTVIEVIVFTPLFF